MAMAEQMHVKGSFEEVCNNPLIEREALRVITEAAFAGRWKKPPGLHVNSATANPLLVNMMKDMFQFLSTN